MQRVRFPKLCDWCTNVILDVNQADATKVSSSATWWFEYRFTAFLHDAGVDRGPDRDLLPVVAFDQVWHLHPEKRRRRSWEIMCCVDVFVKKKGQWWSFLCKILQYEFESLQWNLLKEIHVTFLSRLTKSYTDVKIKCQLKLWHNFFPENERENSICAQYWTCTGV